MEDLAERRCRHCSRASVELRRLTAVSTRTFASGYEIAAKAFGREIAELNAWEDELSPLTTE